MDVSIIVPTYKPQEYIFECLDSLKRQSLDKEKFEVLIILNGDKEPYYTDIKKWIIENKLNNFKLLYSKLSGVSNARNIGLDLSEGKYIVFIDDDDYIGVNYLEELFIANVKLGSNTIVVTDQIRFEDKSNKILEKIKYSFRKYSIIETKIVFSVVWLKIIPKSIIGDIRFKTEYKNGEDTLFMLEISKNIESVRKTKNETFYYRRIRRNSAHFSKKNKREILKNTFMLFKDFSKFLFKKGYDKKFVFLEMLALFKGMLIQFKN